MSLNVCIGFFSADHSGHAGLREYCNCSNTFTITIYYYSVQRLMTIPHGVEGLVDVVLRWFTCLTDTKRVWHRITLRIETCIITTLSTGAMK